MPFVIGVVLGLGVGFAGAILFAPEKKKQADWPPHFPDEQGAAGGNHGSESGLKGFVESVKGRLNEAAEEAKEAQQQKEREMIERYERTIGRKSDS
jgi:gas vesicle protein